MVGSSGANGKGKAPSRSMHRPGEVIFLDDNDEEDDFVSILEPIGIPSRLRNSRNISSSNAGNESLQEVSFLSDREMGLGQQYMNQGHNVIASCGVGSFGEESFNGPQLNNKVDGSSSLFCARDTVPDNNRNNVSFDTNRSGVQGKFESKFLSLGLGGTSETGSSSQLDRREICGKLKEAMIARSRKASHQTLDDGFVGNNSGPFDQNCHVSRMALINQEFVPNGSPSSGLGSSPRHILRLQRNDRQLGRADKLTKAASSDFMDFRRNNIGFDNQFSNADQVRTNYKVGAHSKLKIERGSGGNHVSQMQPNDSGNTRSGDLDHYRGKLSVHSGTLGGSSVNSQQQNLKPAEFVNPSRMSSYYTPSEQLQHFCSTTANSPNYAVASQIITPTQVLEGNLFSQRTATPQVSRVGRGLAGTDSTYPKRLGVEFASRNSCQSSQGHLSPIRRSLRTTNTGQSSDKGSIHMPHNVVRPIGRSDGAHASYPMNAHVSYPMNYQEPFFTYDQSQSAPIQAPKVHQGTACINASTVDSQSQKLDFLVRHHHKRTAAALQSDSHGVKRQKMIHPTFHHSMPKPLMPVTSTFIHPSIQVRSRTQPVAHITAHVKPRVHVARAPALSPISGKDPDATCKLSGYKCYICKRDLALTSEGPVLQQAVRPSVAVLPCGHTFHDKCLENITPDDQAKDPPCIPCAIGEN